MLDIFANPDPHEVTLAVDDDVSFHPDASIRLPLQRVTCKGLTMAHYNCNGLLSHIDQLRFAFKSTPFDILALSETKLSMDILEGEFSIPNYKTIFRRDRRNRNGGGVLIMAKENLHAIPKPTITGDIETVWAEIQLPSAKPILIASCYRPPDQSPTMFLQDLEKQLELLPRDAPAYLLGGFQPGHESI